MRLHSLEVTAVGPFAGTERVDFDALGADGLFLLHGPTGAGKTSVLDAVALALFGTVPGARREGRRLRSDHAADGVGPQVVLELTVGGRRVRLVRRPEWQRPKKRGTGTTKEPAQASLTWVDEPGSEGITRIDEVARVVEGLLGMSADQFFQVVLLPQGEFARFLRAGTDERATLLQRLFDTGRFASAEAWLAERRRSTAAAADAGRREVEVLLGQVATAAGSDGPAEDDALGWARAQRDAATATEEARCSELEQARAAATAAEAELAAATEHAGLLARRTDARDRLAVLAASAGQRTDATRLLDAA
ncbi:AAA family ATPase, partial [Rhodococcus aerolatus]